MPDDQPIPIPVDLNLCTSQSDLTLFIQLLELNFQLIIQITEETQSQTITLPGMQQFSIPGYEYGIQTRKLANREGWIGGRYPLNFPDKNLKAKGTFPELNFGGTDPLTYILNSIGYNIQYIIEQIPTVVTHAVPVPLIINSPCDHIPEIIQQINEQLQNIIDDLNGGGGGGDVCPGEITVPAFDGGCWTGITSSEDSGHRQEVEVTGGGHTLNFIVGRGGAANPASGAPAGGGCDVAGKTAIFSAILGDTSGTHPECGPANLINCQFVDLKGIVMDAALTDFCVPNIDGPIVFAVPLNVLVIVGLTFSIKDYDSDGGLIGSRDIYRPSTTDEIVYRLFFEYPENAHQSELPTTLNCPIQQPPLPGTVRSALSMGLSLFSPEEETGLPHDVFLRYEFTGSVTIGPTFNFHN